MPNLELISFDLCPFVQRSVTILLKKEIRHEVTYIDLQDRPDWFWKLSPLGKVPCLKVDGEVLFESAVINEYLDEITPGTMLPTEPLEKAKHRAWIEFSSQMIMAMFHMAAAQNEKEYEEKKRSFFKLMDRLEEACAGTDCFEGHHFGLVDAAVTPVLHRLVLMEQTYGINWLASYPKLSRWANFLAQQDYVKNSLPENFVEKNHRYLVAKESYLALGKLNS